MVAIWRVFPKAELKEQNIGFLNSNEAQFVPKMSEKAIQVLFGVYLRNVPVFVRRTSTNGLVLTLLKDYSSPPNFLSVLSNVASLFK